MNSSRQNILFSIGTSGHLVNSLSIIGELEKENVERNYYFLDFCKGDKSVTGIEGFRFTSSNVKVIKIENEDGIFFPSLKPVLELDFERVFIYLEHHLRDAFLAKYFKSKKAIICIANDGNRPYYKVNRIATFSRIKAMVKFYKDAKKNKLPKVPFYIHTSKYGKLKYIDEYWVPFKTERSWAHIPQKSIKYYTLFNKLASAIVDESFSGFKEINEMPFSKNKIIFYTNNIVYRKKMYEAEVDALRLVKENTNLPLIIKMHPGTPDFQKEAFESLADYTFQSTIPAEFYMMKIQDSIFLSGWSSSLLYNNRMNCKYFWLYAYFLTQGLPIKDLVDFSLPNNHIQHPIKLKEITL